MKYILSPLATTLFGAALLVCLAQDSPRPNGPSDGPPRREGGPGGRGGMMRQHPLMVALDTDKNGTLSAAEIANAPAALKTLDANHDGQLNPEELRPNFPEGGRGGPRGDNSAEALNRLLAYDKNNDGKLTADELPERMRDLIARADEDKDGALSKEELTRFLSRQPPGTGGPDRGGDRGGRNAPAGPDRPPASPAPQPHNVP